MPELSIQTANEEGETVTRVLHLEEEHAEEDRNTVQSLADQAEQVPELREERDELEDELGSMREVLVDECIRRQKLAGKIGEDAELSIDEQREYLEGLPAKRLKMEYERAMKLDIDTGGALDPGKTPEDPGGEPLAELDPDA